jgi:hypothetical protein
MQSLLIINYLCKFKLHERAKQSLLCHMLNNLFSAFLGLSFVHYMVLWDFIFLKSFVWCISGLVSRALSGFVQILIF